MKKKLTFTELGRINLSEGRDVVVSKVNETGNVSITHSVLETLEDGKQVKFFLKNSTVLTPDTLAQFIGILSQATPSTSVVETATKNKGKKVKS